MGFVQGLSTQTASGVVTTTTTITSTYYVSWHDATTSTRFTKTYAGIVTQETVGFTTIVTLGNVFYYVQDGPYLKIEISFWCSYYSGAEVPLQNFVNGRITNLMNEPIEKVSIFLLCTNKDRTLTEETSLDFISIPAKMSEGFERKTIPLTRRFLIDDVYYRILRTVIVYKGIIYVDMPAETYTFSRTGTSTYVATYFATNTLNDVQIFLSSGGTILLLVVVAGAMVAVFAFSRKKGSPPERKEETPEKPSPKEEIPTKPSVQDLKPSVQTETVSKFCRHCGAKIPHDSAFCEACGMKL
jgi:ribosomal protein L40E